MPFIRGEDDLGKEHWLQESGYWGDRLHATNFTPAKANEWLAEIRKRNAYLNSHDRIIPEIHNVP